ncbi:hypothetical protein [Curtobacterium sp. MCBD17_008]|nr:hypothetical protein [Curtobacterium sp. MCBD17_008]
MESGVDLVALYRRAPADHEVVERVMEEHCPESVTGPWVRYPAAELL